MTSDFFDQQVPDDYEIIPGALPASLWLLPPEISPGDTVIVSLHTNDPRQSQGWEGTVPYGGGDIEFAKVSGPYKGDDMAHAKENDLSDAARFLLKETTGLDVETEHGANTPDRFIKMLRELTAAPAFEFTVFDNKDPMVDEMVTVEKIPFVSVCNHHIIPFIGYAYIAYIPATEIVGLSKFARVVHHYARQLQVQERLTYQIADFLEDKLKPVGVGVVLRAEHMCMTVRGVQTPGAMTTTSAMRGVFSDHDKTAKAEFLSFIRSS